VVVGQSSSLIGGSQIAAESVWVRQHATVGEVYFVDDLLAEGGATYTPKTGYVPLFLGMPIFPVFSAGGSDETLSGVESLPAGSYGELRIKPKAIVTLTGGDYYFTSIDVDPNAKLMFDAATNVHVTGRVNFGKGAKVGPALGSGISAQDVIFWIAGADGPPGKPTTFVSGNGVQMRINAYTRNGTLTIGPYNSATGAFLGLRVTVLTGTTLHLASAFDYPYP
jgi:hypothetical protein